MIHDGLAWHTHVFSRVQAYLRLSPRLLLQSSIFHYGWPLKNYLSQVQAQLSPLDGKAFSPRDKSQDVKKWKKKMGSSRTDCCFTATVTQLRGGRQLRQGQQSGSSGLPAKNSSSSGTPSASSDEETPLVTRPALLPASWLPALANTTLTAALAAAASSVPCRRRRRGNHEAVCRVVRKEGWRSAHWRVGLTWAS